MKTELEQSIEFILQRRQEYLIEVEKLGIYGETKHEILSKLHDAAIDGKHSITIYRTSQEETDEIFRIFNKDFLVKAYDWIQEGWPEGYRITIEFRD